VKRHIKGVLSQVVDHLAPAGLVAMEMAEDQVPSAVEEILKLNAFASWCTREDLAGRRRFLLAEKEGSRC
jgi:methylase of polypeptide subunit release factors